VPLVAQILLWLAPWPLRRALLSIFYGYNIDKSARLGFCVILSKSVELGPNSRIGHLTLIKGLDELRLGSASLIGRLNWITGRAASNREFFTGDITRRSALIVEDHAAITHRHLIDCSATVHVGAFATVAGWRSQILTHSIDVTESRQSASPVSIGAYSFVGTSVTILKGAVLPARSVLAAGSVLAEPQQHELTLYGGVPARPLRDLDPALAYFQRSVGFVR
jgi:acetyltransferase-like isoleucine patch superfamily enzyme